MSSEGFPLLTDEEIAALTDAEAREYLDALEAEAEAIAHTPWAQRARPNQLAPAGDWFVWLILAGRGWGKTRVGAEWTAAKARTYPGCRVALVAQAFADGRDTMVEGESGLAGGQVLADHEIRQWNRSMGQLVLMNGSRFQVYTSEKPRQLRGPQHHFAWVDEPATFYDAQQGPAEDTTWSNLTLGCRLSMDGSSPQIVATGTPKPVPLIALRNGEPPGLIHQEGVEITRGHTDENLDNLAPTYRKRVVDPMRGTRLGRQELAAELLEDLEGALWSHAWIDEHRVTAPPRLGFTSTVLGLDPADGTAAGDEQGSCLAARDMNGELYVVRSDGGRESPGDWLEAMVVRARDYGAVIVVEKNHGGAYLTDLLEKVMRETGVRAPVKVVTASVGKRVRAEPVAMLYEQGHVHHLGHHPELEEQLVGWDGTGASPDRLDAAVWALTELMGYGGAGLGGEGGAVVYPDLVRDGETGNVRLEEPEDVVRRLGRSIDSVEHGAIPWGNSPADPFEIA